jgi:hypothetical protein
MTAQQIVIISGAVAVAVVALLGAIATWRALSRAGAGLRSAAERLDARTEALPERLKNVGFRLAEVSVETERMLWRLGNLDDRLDKTTADMRAKRVASDTLHVRLIESRLTIARLKQLVRLMIRLGELRRVVL